MLQSHCFFAIKEPSNIWGKVHIFQKNIWGLLQIELPISLLIKTLNFRIQKSNRQNPLWQANYYDHIIRNETEYQNISEYIANNPIKWEEDM